MMAEKKMDSNDADALVASCITVEDFEEASTALRAIKKLDASLARQVALKILRERIGDVFYRAFAFEILYSVALDDAVAYIESNASTESVYILGAMLEAVTDDVGALSSRGKILEAVSLLKKVLVLRSSEDLGSIAMKRMNFEEAYR